MTMMKDDAGHEGSTLDQGVKESVSPQSASGREPGGTSDRLSEERCQAFIESIDEGVYEMDIDGRLVYFNDALCKVFGYPREEMKWQSLIRIMGQEQASAADEIFSEIRQTGSGISGLTWEIRGPDSQTRIIELSANLITNREGEKVGFRGIARVATERHKAQKALKESEPHCQRQYEASREAEKRYRALLEFVPYPLVVFMRDKKVSYLNPAFTETFGWGLDELQGKPIPYIPAGFNEELREGRERPLKEKLVLRYESKRRTKDGRILDVVIRETAFSENEEEPGGELVILRDITSERKMARNTETLLRISTALPSHPDLEDLLDFISTEMKNILDVEGAMVILLDEEKKEFFFLGGAYDDGATRIRAREIRFPMDRGVAGKVVRTGQAVIVPDTSRDPDFYSFVAHKLGLPTRNMMDVPLRSGDRIIGVLCTINKKEGTFDQADVELLSMIAGTVELSVENAHFSDELKEAYKTVTSLNRAKDRTINHLSHELKTPASILLASLKMLEKRLSDLPERSWRPALDRANRSLGRILEIQRQVEDIMQDKYFKTAELLNLLLDQCTDELEALAAVEVGEGSVVKKIRQRITEIYGPKESKISQIRLDRFLQGRLEALRPGFAHRAVEVSVCLEEVPRVCLPEAVLQKVVDGLVRNAIEATPDQGMIEILVRRKGDGAELVVRDCGIGITEDNQRRIFEGFFSTQEAMVYSSRRPFDFNAGGKGADLLRMKIFAERFGFTLDLASERCDCIPRDSDLCPGRIDACGCCQKREDCFKSGGTYFTVYFPGITAEKCPPGPDSTLQAERGRGTSNL
jgi:PAS domain S-box-containing protein